MLNQFRIEFFLPGRPVAKGRPRLTTRGGFARAYTPPKTVAAEARVRMYALAALAALGSSHTGADGSLYRVTAKIFQRASGRIIGAPAAGRPDVDNVVKLILDALNGVIWLDDGQVADLHVTRVSGPAHGCHVAIERIGLEA